MIPVEYLEYRNSRLSSQIMSGENHSNYGKHLSEETKRKISEALSGENHHMYGKKHSESDRRKMKINHANINGKNNPRWNGGTSFLPYSSLFNLVIKEYVRARDGYQCQFCDTSENGKAHSVHHIDHDKDNDSEYNLLTLCMDCHNNESASTGELRAEWMQYCIERIREIYMQMTEERRVELQRLRTDLEARI